MADPLVDITELARSFGGRTVIDRLTMRLDPGMMIGLVGANGGGKTTSLRMIAGLLAPDRGNGTVLGVPVERSGMRPGLGYMPQRLSLYPELTVRENLRFRVSVHAGNSQQALDEAIDRWGLASVVDQRFDRLSGGWGRRVQFAATMIGAPRLLLLDEPTAGLDVVTRRLIWQWLAAFTASGGGVIISTHDLAEAGACPQIIHYHGGEARGPIRPADLIRELGVATLEDAVAQLA